jgi:hypothetical protein
MARLYDENSAKMVRHNDPLIQPDVMVVRRNFLPIIVGNLSNRSAKYFRIGNSARNGIRQRVQIVTK